MPAEIFTGHTFTKIKTQLKKGVSGVVVYRDGVVGGLAVKLTPKGGSWYFSTRVTNIRIAPFESFGLNDLPDLRALVVEIHKQLAQGREVKALVETFAAGAKLPDANNAQAVEYGEGVTWEVARDEYLAWALINKNVNTYRGYRSALGVSEGLRDDFQPIHGKPLASITTADLARVRNNIVQRGRDGTAKGQGIRQANLTVSALKACFKYAINNLGFNLTSNPARDLSKSLDRIVYSESDQEVRALTQLELGAPMACASWMSK